MSDRSPRTVEGRTIVFGEVLFDVFPDGRKVAGGAPYNVARHLAVLGFDPLFVSRVGDDDAGRVILEDMESLGMDRSGVSIDPERPTGFVDVRIMNGEPEYDIIQDVAWDHIKAPGDVAVGLLYHGSLAMRSDVSAAALGRLKDAPRFVDLNLRTPWYTPESVKACIDGADALKVNGDEMQVLCGMLGIGMRSMAEAATRIVRDMGLAKLYVTDGERGALGLARGGEPVRVAAAKPSELVDTVGAGDAFSAVCLCGQLKGWDMAATLERAASLAADVCGLRGAFPETADFHAGYTHEWGLQPWR